MSPKHAAQAQRHAPIDPAEGPLRTVQAQHLEAIPVGHYHEVMERGHPVRQAWHRLKFTRVEDLLPDAPELSILDIGCFAGSFLSGLDPRRFSRQLGVDILPEQIDYANRHFGTAFRQYRHVRTLEELARIDGQFDCVTLIEVIEHLRPEEIREALVQASHKLKPNGWLVVSTPNYASAWPLLEVMLNRVSDVSYDEQHITKFNYFNAESKLRTIWPGIDAALSLETKTTTHLLTPFLAMFGVERAMGLAARLPHRTWKVPFGNLLLLAFKKR